MTLTPLEYGFWSMVCIAIGYLVGIHSSTRLQVRRFILQRDVRECLQDKLLAATVDLLQESGASSVWLPIPNTDPKLYVAVGVPAVIEWHATEALGLP